MTSQMQGTVLVRIFWNVTMFQYRSNWPEVNPNLTSIITNLLYELPSKLRLRILGKQEIEKSQILVKTEPSAQSPSQNLNFGNSNQKYLQIYQSFVVLSNFTEFLYFVLNILYKIVDSFRLNFRKFPTSVKVCFY